MFDKKFIIGLIIAVIIGLGSGYFLGHDNPIEELSEMFIKHTTSFEVDLTPNSKEVIIYDENR